jgi:branched-chain amino acid transport system permease protein
VSTSPAWFVTKALLPIAVTATILLLLPTLWFADSQYTTGLAVTAVIFACYAVGFNLIFGSTNQLFLCVGALAAIGGYTAALLSERASVSIWIGIAAGTLVASTLGALLSWIAVRRSLDVIFTGIVTLVFSLALSDLLSGQRNLTGGDTGHVLTKAAIHLTDTSLGGYYLFVGVLIAFLLAFRALQLSHIGWAFRALRDGETAAELAGVDVARYRIYAAAVGSAMIGLTGALYAYSDGFISPSSYAFDQVDVRVLVVAAFGGLGSLLGPVIGAGTFAFLDRALTSSGQLREVYYGAFLIVIFLGFRHGVGDTFARLIRGIGHVIDRVRRQAAPAPVSRERAEGHE